MKIIKVATFCRKGETRVSRVNAYTYWYVDHMSDCITYEVEAINGTEAKKIAKQLRLKHEKEARDEQD